MFAFTMAQSELSHVVKSKPHSDHRLIIPTFSPLCVGFVAKTPSTWAMRRCWGTRAIRRCRLALAQNRSLFVHTAVEHTTSRAYSSVGLTLGSNTY